MRLRELFRQKFENTEIIPSPQLKSKLMRKLAFSEFLHFNAARFNVYYLSGIIVAGITLAVLVSSGKDHRNQTPIRNVPEKAVEKASQGISNPDTVQIRIQKVAPAKINIPEISDNKLNNKPESRNGSVPKTSPDLVRADKNIIAQTGLKDSFSKRNMFDRAKPEKNKLQGGIKVAKALIEASATKGCAPLDVKFFNSAVSFDSCAWIFGDGGYSTETNPEWIYDVEGEFRVELNIFLTGGNEETFYQNITVYPRPVAHFETAPEKAVLPGDEIRFYNYSTNAVHSMWDFGDGSSSELFEPRHKYLKSGNYDVRLVVSSDHGCSDSVVVLNAFSGSEYYINFPNAFIPNDQGPTGGYYSSKSDEEAQVFHPVCSGVSDYQLKIFSKMGILIFETSDISIGWDGYFKGQLSDPGVYIWKVRGSFRNGEPFIKMGDVTLLRN